MACREYTLPRDEETSEPKGWIIENTKNWARIGSGNLLACKVNMELRFKQVGHEFEQQRAGNL